MKTERRSFKLLLFWNSAEVFREHLLDFNGQRSSHGMLAWLIIAFVTVAGTGTVAYFYFKLLNYFIKMKIEAEPDPKQQERETKLKKNVSRPSQDKILTKKELTYSEKLITVT